MRFICENKPKLTKVTLKGPDGVEIVWLGGTTTQEIKEYLTQFVSATAAVETEEAIEKTEITSKRRRGRPPKTEVRTDNELEDLA